MSTWADDLTTVLTQLGGQAKLRDIYAGIERTRPKLPIYWHSTVREKLQEHCAEATRYTGKADLFYRVDRGVWGIKKKEPSLTLVTASAVLEEIKAAGVRGATRREILASRGWDWRSRQDHAVRHRLPELERAGVISRMDEQRDGQVIWVDSSGVTKMHAVSELLPKLPIPEHCKQKPSAEPPTTNVPELPPDFEVAVGAIRAAHGAVLEKLAAVTAERDAMAERIAELIAKPAPKYTAAGDPYWPDSNDYEAFDHDHDADVTHTKIVSVHFNDLILGDQHRNWNSLLQHIMLEASVACDYDAEKMNSVTSIQVFAHDKKDKRLFFVPGLGYIHGVSAKHAWREIRGIATALNFRMTIEIQWKENGRFPGRTATYKLPEILNC